MNEKDYREIRFKGSALWFNDEPYPEDETIFAYLFAHEQLLIRGDGDCFKVAVICNDIFAWGCADAEPITDAEIGNLFLEVYKSRMWGAVIWCAKKRNEKPQRPVIEQMKKDGVWTDELEALPPNYYDTARLKQYPSAAEMREIPVLEEKAK